MPDFTYFSPVKYFLSLFISILALSGFGQEPHPEAHTHTVRLMGSNFGFTAVHADDSVAWKALLAAEAEVRRIEKLISSWDPESQTSYINRKAGKEAVRVDPELFQLINRSLKVSKVSDGAFDISFASIEKLWKFDGSMQSLPDPEAVRASVARIDYQKIELNAKVHTVFLQEKGMRIGFGGIGKGYAANRAREVMREMGIQAGVVNAGGDLTAWGKQPDGTDWRVGIADPDYPGTVMAWLPVDNGAVVTSGNYERFAVIDGKRYSHIIDPRTGYPVTGLKSVTIVSPDAELADALATAVFVLGKDKGLALVNQLARTECLIITDENQRLTSSGLNMEFYKVRQPNEPEK